MAYADIRICPSCKQVFVEDDQMYVEPERCPHCGADLADEELEDTEP